MWLRPLLLLLLLLLLLHALDIPRHAVTGVTKSREKERKKRRGEVREGERVKEREKNKIKVPTRPNEKGKKSLNGY